MKITKHFQRKHNDSEWRSIGGPMGVRHENENAATSHKLPNIQHLGYDCSERWAKS